MTTTTAQASPGGAPAPARERTSVSDRHKHDRTGAYIAIALLIGILIGLILGYMIPHQVPQTEAAPPPAIAVAPAETNAAAAVPAPAPSAIVTPEPAKPAAPAKPKESPKHVVTAAVKENALAGAPAYHSSSCATGYRRVKSENFAVCVKWPFDDPMGVTAAAWLSVQPTDSLASEGSAEVEGRRVVWTPLTD